MLGLARNNRETIAGLVDAGLVVAGLNVSHDSTDRRATVIDKSGT